MFIDERTVELATSAELVNASEVGWFAARQPGLLRFLEDRLGSASESLGLAVDLCWRLVAAFERHQGMPMARLDARALEAAEEEVVAESHGRLELATGCAHRQPELCRWLARQLADLPVPLEVDELDRLALAVLSCISAADRAVEAQVRAAVRSAS